MSLYDHNISKNPNQDFTNNKHCMNKRMTISVKKSCEEDGFIDESMLDHTIQQLNICIACDMMKGEKRILAENLGTIGTILLLCLMAVIMFWDIVTVGAKSLTWKHRL